MNFSSCLCWDSRICKGESELKRQRGLPSTSLLHPCPVLHQHHQPMRGDQSTPLGCKPPAPHHPQQSGSVQLPTTPFFLLLLIFGKAVYSLARSFVQPMRASSPTCCTDAGTAKPVRTPPLSTNTNHLVLINHQKSTPLIPSIACGGSKKASLAAF